MTMVLVETFKHDVRIYPVTCSNNFILLALVVQTSDSATQGMITVQQISIRETDCIIHSLDSDLFSG